MLWAALTPGELEVKLALESLEGHLYRAVVEAVAEQREVILKYYPSSRGIPCNQGYPLDLLAQGQPWVSHGRPFNLAPFFYGSEGTLVLVTEATLNLVPLPGERVLVAAHFSSLDEALRAVVRVLAHQPVAVELLDKTILLHMRPVLDLTLTEERERFHFIMTEMAELVKEFAGSFSAKHGDGRLRAPFLEAILGPEIVALLGRIKQAADPRSCFNPGKILAAPPLLESLRTWKEAPIESSLAFFDWGKDQGLQGASARCNGAGVDMALMKAEFLQQYQDRHGVPWRGRILSQLQHLAHLGSWLPTVANWILASRLLQRVLKFHPQRQLPLLAHRTFSCQLRTRPPHIHTDPRGEVVLINDLWTEFFDLQIGMAAVSCLEQLGYKVIVTPWLSAGRIQIS